MLRAFVTLIVGVQFLAVWSCSSTSALAAPAVWSGLTLSFSKAAFANPALAENQDRITDTVWFTRGDSRGLLNAFSECPLGFCSYVNNFSPEGTLWATDVMAVNAGKTIAATNWEQLIFSDWENAYGNSVGNFIIGENAVVRLIGDEDDMDDDIYLDIRFSEWGTAPAGGPFSYMRAEPPAQPPTTGDYNGNGVVDAADFVIWRKTLNQPANPFGSGADGDMDGAIDPGDYDFWAARFGNTVPGSGGGAQAVAAPEPAAAVLLMIGIACVRAVSRKRPHSQTKFAGRRQMIRCRLIAGMIVLVAIALLQRPARAAFHLWQVKEVFTNADGSVQFVELFDSFNSENFVAGHQIRSNSDGVIKTFTIPSNLPSSVTANKHILIATPGFGALPGGVTPNYTLPDPGVSGPFFNPNATNITITFDGSNDSMAFSGALLPKNGYQSLTDNGAFGFPPGTPNILVGTNSPTNFAGASGSVNLIIPTGDYNGDGVVNAADYVVWRKTLSQSANPAGTGADGDKNGTIGPDDYGFWAARFGNTVPGSGGGAVNAAVPEPASGVLLLLGLLFGRLRFLALDPRRDPALCGVLRG